MNKYFAFIISTLFLVSCAEQQLELEKKNLPLDEISVLSVPSNTSDVSSLDYNNKTSEWRLDGELFSGYAIEYYPDKTLKKKFGILDGKKQNDAIQWFPDGHIRFSAHYHKGKLHGEKKTYSTDPAHVLVAHYQYYLAKAHGIQKSWYSTGEVLKVLELNMGKEEGMQQAFRKNGSLYANYEAKEGRNFGIKRAALCFELENESVLFVK